MINNVLFPEAVLLQNSFPTPLNSVYKRYLWEYNNLIITIVNANRLLFRSVVTGLYQAIQFTFSI